MPFRSPLRFNLAPPPRDGPAAVELSPGGARPPEPAELRLLIQFMSEIGAAMNGAGDATTFIRRSLQRIGNAYGMRNLGVFAVPTLLLLRYGDDRATLIDLSSQIPVDLRLDQTAALYELVAEAEAGSVRPSAGLSRLSEILKRPARFSGLMRVCGPVLVTTGIILLLEPSRDELLLAVGLALMVGLITQLGDRWPQLWPLIPAAAGLVAGACTFLLLKAGLECRPLLVVVPPLATFLPGAALTVSMIELANGDIVAGGSRLAYGAGRLFVLVFGVVVAAQWIGLPAQTAVPETIPFSAYLWPLGLLAFCTGVFVRYSGPRGAFPWLLLVTGAAWAGQQLGGLFLGGYLSGFAGGTVMIVAAVLIRGRPGAPPLLVSFTPAFWLLVPGALGLEGLSEIAQKSLQAGLQDVLAMIVTMISIALGVLFGLIVSGSSRSREPV